MPYGEQPNRPVCYKGTGRHYRTLLKTLLQNINVGHYYSILLLLAKI